MEPGGTHQLAGASAKQEQIPPLLSLLYLASPALFWNISCSGKPHLGSSNAKRRTLGLYWTQAWVWSLQKVHTKETHGFLLGTTGKATLAPSQVQI